MADKRKTRQTQLDETLLQRALNLARRGVGQTTPNPAVGAVIARGDRILGQGYHRRAGEPHAEIEALRDAGGPVRGATLYVTLEPCSHFGRTPPCADAIIRAGIARVVFPLRDPDPRVRGRGERRLRAAGIQVERGLLRDEAIALNESFLFFHATGRPLVTCKWAVTLDGQAAAASGDSKWISNAASRRYVHDLRGRSDAVLCGIGTVLVDNPSLTARGAGCRGRQPIRVIADAALRTPLGANCIHAQPGGPTWFLTTRVAPASRVRQFEAAGCRVLRVPGRRAIIDFSRAIAALGEQGVQSIFVEGGPSVHAALIRAGLCDRVVAFVAPKVIGTPPGWRRTPVYGWGRDRMRDALGLVHVRIRHFDGDVCIEGDLPALAGVFRRL